MVVYRSTMHVDEVCLATRERLFKKLLKVLTGACSGDHAREAQTTDGACYACRRPTCALTSVLVQVRLDTRCR